MRIRWKLLLIFLTLSLLPALAIGLSGLSAMLHMGQDVASRTRDTLSNQAMSSMHRLVEDHALVLRREFDLLESVLNGQAHSIEALLAHPPVHAQSYVPAVSESMMGMGMKSGMEDKPASMEAAAEAQNMGIFTPQDMNITGSESESVRALSHMAPQHESAKKLLGRLALRQFTALDDGIFAFYPARTSLPAGSVPAMYDPRRMPWYAKPLATGGTTWSLPYSDPFTGEPVITVSTPVHVNGQSVGVTAICVPLRFLLHQNPQHLLYSGLHTWILRPASQPDNSIGLRLVTADVPIGDTSDVNATRGAQPDMHHLWRLPKEAEWFRLEDPAMLKDMIEDLANGRSGDKLVRLAGHAASGETWLLAYASIFPGGTVLVIAVPEKEAVAQAIATSGYITSQTLMHGHTVVLGLAAVLAVCIIVALLISRHLTRIVAGLSETVSRVAKGDFSVRAKVRSSDELGDLARTFNSLVPALEDQVRMQKTLYLAQGIQAQLQPHRLPVFSKFEVAGCSYTCDETGGDYYDFIELMDGRLVAVVGDVSGHGLPAALLMASIRGFLRGRSMVTDSLSAMTRDVNRLVLVDTHGSGEFMTLFLLALDPTSGRVSWLRAGHSPALLYAPSHPDERVAAVHELSGKGGLALGVVADAVYEENEGPVLVPGQVILLATDGVWEAENETGQTYGKDRLKTLLSEVAHKSADEIRRFIVADVHQFLDYKKQDDDVTVVVVKALDA